MLHYAVMNEKLDLIKLLLVSGACRTVINAVSTRWDSHPDCPFASHSLANRLVAGGE